MSIHLLFSTVLNFNYFLKPIRGFKRSVFEHASTAMVQASFTTPAGFLTSNKG